MCSLFQKKFFAHKEFYSKQIFGSSNFKAHPLQEFYYISLILHYQVGLPITMHDKGDTLKSYTDMTYYILVGVGLVPECSAVLHGVT